MVNNLINIMFSRFYIHHSTARMSLFLFYYQYYYISCCFCVGFKAWAYSPSVNPFIGMPYLWFYWNFIKKHFFKFPGGDGPISPPLPLPWPPRVHLCFRPFQLSNILTFRPYQLSNILTFRPYQLSWLFVFLLGAFIVRITFFFFWPPNAKLWAKLIFASQRRGHN